VESALLDLEGVLGSPLHRGLGHKCDLSGFHAVTAPVKVAGEKAEGVRHPT
jgi:hypothetical protein